MNQDATKNTSLSGYLRPVWRRKWLILALVVLVTGATYAYYRTQPNQYSANTAIYLQPSGTPTLLGGSAANAQYTQRTVDDQASLIQSPPVAVLAARLLGGHRNPQALLSQVTVSPASTDDFITISTQARRPAYAARLVNAFARAYIGLQLQDALADARRALATTQRDLKALGTAPSTAAARATLQATADQLEAEVALPSADAQQVDVATAPRSPISPRPARDALYALVLALLLGILVAYMLERFDARLDEVDDLTPIWGNSVLAAVPLAPTGSARDGELAFAEAFHTLRTALIYARNGAEPPKSILVTSASPEEGKTTIVRNLAAAYAATGARVAVVDCDLRRPALAGAFGVPTEPGLSDVLVGAKTVRAALAHAALEEAESLPGSHPIDVLAAGAKHANVPGLLASPRLPRVLAELSRSHDIVLVDTPPILAVSDALGLVGCVDGVLVVSRVGRTTAEQADQALKLLERTHGVHLLGVVANGAPAHRGYSGYTYGDQAARSPA